ncbi:MAG: hypothetical protein JSS07_01495 [Proteobacteria bacterium]|nr:hypothetical protein [Pseudomonadota bacterium]
MLMKEFVSLVNWLYGVTPEDIAKREAEKLAEIARLAEIEKLANLEIGKQVLGNATLSIDTCAKKLAQETAPVSEEELVNAAMELEAKKLAEEAAIELEAKKLAEEIAQKLAEEKAALAAAEAAKNLAVNMTDTVCLANHTAFNATLDTLNTTTANQTIVNEVCQAISKLPCSDADLTCRFNDFLDENFPGVELKGPINDITRTVGTELSGGKLDMSKFDISDYMNMTNTPVFVQEKLKSVVNIVGMNPLTFGLIAGVVSLAGLYGCMGWYKKQSKEVQSKIDKATFDIIKGNAQLVALFNASVVVRDMFAQASPEEISKLAERFNDGTKVTQFLQMDAGLQKASIQGFKSARAAEIERAKNEVAKVETAKVVEQPKPVVPKRELQQLLILTFLDSNQHRKFAEENFKCMSDQEIQVLAGMSKLQLTHCIRHMSHEKVYASWLKLTTPQRTFYLDQQLASIAKMQKADQAPSSSGSASYTPMLQAQQAQAKAEEKAKVEVKAAEDRKKPSA